MTGLFSDSEGDPSKPPVVLLHGFGGHHGIWTRVRADIGDKAHTIAYDVPGHGQSLGLTEAASPRRAAAAILGDMAQGSLTGCHLVGHSMGGAIATLMAIAEPSRFASLTLLAPGGFGETINEQALRRFAEARSAAQLADALRPMCSPGHEPDSSDIAALVTMRALPGQSDILRELVGRIAQGGRQGVIPRELIAALPMPVTIVWGEEDEVLSPRGADGLPPHIAVRRLAGVGHMLPEECPQIVAGLIMAAVNAA